MTQEKMLLVLVLVIVVLQPAYGAQLDVSIPINSEAIQPNFKFLRVFFIDYPEGGKIANLLKDQQKTITISVDSQTAQDDLVLELNKILRESSSSSSVKQVVVNYQATLSGHDAFASIEFKIEVIPTVSDFLLRKQVGNIAGLVETQWRGISFDDPVIVSTEEYGNYDINDPKSFLMEASPQLLSLIEGTAAASIFETDLIDASNILSLPLIKWHRLFDPTAVTEEAKKAGFSGDAVISLYSMGTCDIYTGVCKDKIEEIDFTLDKRYTIRSLESQDDATIALEGYATSTIIDDIEVFGVSAQSPEWFSPENEFPVSVIYGMAGMAGVGAIAVLFISNRKLKKEEGMGQTGIDPSFLQARETSIASGSYQTNRGEGHLRDETALNQQKKSPI